MEGFYLTIVVVYIITSLAVGFIGQNRKIGFGAAFAAALFFTPGIGIIVAFMSPDFDQLKKEKAEAQMQMDQLNMLASIAGKLDVPVDEINTVMEKHGITFEE